VTPERGLIMRHHCIRGSSCFAPVHYVGSSEVSRGGGCSYCLSLRFDVAKALSGVGLPPSTTENTFRCCPGAGGMKCEGSMPTDIVAITSDCIMLYS